MDDIEIRPAGIGDVATIYGLVLDLARYERLEAEFTASEEDLRALLFGPRPFAEAILARAADQAAGFAVFFHNVSTFAGKPGLFLEDLYVRPEFRRRGIGQALLRFVAGLALARGCRRMEWMALDWNRPALDLYARAGARVRESWVTLRLEGAALENLASGRSPTPIQTNRSAPAPLNSSYD